MSTKKMHALLSRDRVIVQQPDKFWPMEDELMGIEIEVESANKIPTVALNNLANWKTVEDHSLRNGIEFVLRNPSCGKTLRDAISEFFAKVKGYSTSSRTSTHIHVNAMDDNMTPAVLSNMLCLYSAAEDYFFTLAGPEREWSNFCNRIEQAPASFISSILRDNWSEADLVNTFSGNKLNQNTDRYYAFNLHALARHGTIEFRHFPVPKDEQQLISWVKDIMYLKRASIHMAEKGVAAADALSGEDAEVIKTLQEFLPELIDNILNVTRPDRISSKVAALKARANIEGDNKKGYSPSFKTEDKGVFGSFIKKLGIKETKHVNPNFRLDRTLVFGEALNAVAGLAYVNMVTNCLYEVLVNYFGASITAVDTTPVIRNVNIRRTLVKLMVRRMEAHEVFSGHYVSFRDRPEPLTDYLNNLGYGDLCNAIMHYVPSRPYAEMLDAARRGENANSLNLPTTEQEFDEWENRLMEVDAAQQEPQANLAAGPFDPRQDAMPDLVLRWGEGGLVPERGRGGYAAAQEQARAEAGGDDIMNELRNRYMEAAQRALGNRVEAAQYVPASAINRNENP